MDNIQLAILLRQYVARLDAAINEAEVTLPSEAFIERRQRFTLHGTYKACPALDGLRELSADMEADVARLERDTNVSAAAARRA